MLTPTHTAPTDHRPRRPSNLHLGTPFFPPYHPSVGVRCGREADTAIRSRLTRDHNLFCGSIPSLVNA